MTPENSVCATFLENESPPGGVYQVLSSRLLRAVSTNRLLEAAFRDWDTVLPPGVHENNTHGRCLQEAKRLTCLLAFPRCLEIDSTEAELADLGEDDADEDFLSPREFPVCR